MVFPYADRYVTKFHVNAFLQQQKSNAFAVYCGGKFRLLAIFPVGWADVLAVEGVKIAPASREFSKKEDQTDSLWEEKNLS